jgi:hypothetical protein
MFFPGYPIRVQRGGDIGSPDLEKLTLKITTFGKEKSLYDDQQ